MMMMLVRRKGVCIQLRVKAKAGMAARMRVELKMEVSVKARVETTREKTRGKVMVTSMSMRKRKPIEWQGGVRDAVGTEAWRFRHNGFVYVHVMYP
jgi:hypothetical protein